MYQIDDCLLLFLEPELKYLKSFFPLKNLKFIKNCIYFKLAKLMNVKGANSAIKRRKILLYLKQKNTDLVFLQETHLEKEDLLLLQRDWVGNVLYSAGASSQRGVAILILKNFNIKILKQQSDEKGRWLAIDAELFGIRCTFMNIYAPTADLPGFFVEVSNEITQFGNSYVVLGGDFNNVRNPNVDKTCFPRF
uniref:exodeoxyribonuclease III n=1 Tax=Mola mola TaxID=94237 RepID=A0A3Q3WRJ0_MOLML